MVERLQWVSGTIQSSSELSRRRTPESTRWHNKGLLENGSQRHLDVEGERGRQKRTYGDQMYQRSDSRVDMMTKEKTQGSFLSLFDHGTVTSVTNIGTFILDEARKTRFTPLTHNCSRRWTLRVVSYFLPRFRSFCDTLKNGKNYTEKELTRKRTKDI